MNWNALAFTPKTTSSALQRPSLAITPNDSKSTPPPPDSLLEHQALFEQLEKYAEEVLSNEPDVYRRVPLMRLQAEDLGYPISEKLAGQFLTKAAGRAVGIQEPRRKGERMDTTPTGFGNSDSMGGGDCHSSCRLVGRWPRRPASSPNQWGGISGSAWNGWRPAMGVNGP